MFGTANQLLATIALTVGTSYLINNGKVRYAWVTLIPLVFVGITTLTAGTMNIIGIYIPQLSVDKSFVKGLINLVMTAVIMISVLIILKDAVPSWIKAYRESRMKLAA
jgi:carbon starvation protein